MTSIRRIPRRVIGPMAVAAALSVAVSLCATPALARTPAIQFPDAEKTVADTRSEAYAQKEKEALVLWEADKRDEAKTMLYRQSTDAPPPDAAAAKLRLGYMNLDDKNVAEAKRLFEAVADMPSGVNDAAKAEAAERIAHIAMDAKEFDLCRARFHRLLSGEYEITNERAVDICLCLGSLERRLNNFQAGVPYYEQIALHAANPGQRVRGLTTLAELWVDIACGLGVPPLPVEEHSAARDKARQYCRQILGQVGPEPGKIVPLDCEMFAELLYLESFYYQHDYATSYELGSRFLDRWSADPSRYEDNAMKIHVNTARTFHTLNAYITGHFEDSLAVAEALVVDPPPDEERLGNFDALMYGCVCGALSAKILNLPAEAAYCEQIGRLYNERHFDLLSPAIETRRSNHLSSIAR